METVRRVQLATVAVLLFVVLVSGPLVGAVDLTPPSHSDTVGDGSANVTVVSDPASTVHVDEGQFGTDVYYLRIPPAVLDVSHVEGRPRIVYVTRVPALGFQRTTSRVLHAGDRGRVAVRPAPRAFAHDRLAANRTYRVELIVRVQSFEMDRVLYHRNASVSRPRVGG
ncbi:MAG: hypothetical protein ABEJ31_07510 [Haloarculaceae archaeon]